MTVHNPSNPKRIGYARVSTDNQTLYQYTDLLNGADCNEIYLDDGVSAVAAKRPELIKARGRLNPGDTFIVPAIDRAFRSTIEGIMFLDGLHAEGICFESIYQQIDTRTPEGRKWFIDMVNNAEYERAVISRRTKEKMAAAKRKGIHCGRPRKLTEAKVRKAHDHIDVALRQLLALPVVERARAYDRRADHGERAHYSAYPGEHGSGCCPVDRRRASHFLYPLCAPYRPLPVHDRCMWLSPTTFTETHRSAVSPDLVAG